MFALALILLVAGAFAQEQNSPATATEALSRSAVEIRREASERLRMQAKIELTKGGVVLIVIYPAEKQMQAYRGVKECFVGKMPVEDIFVNSSGYLTVITRAKVRGCNDSRININPINRIAGLFDYNVDTKEQSKNSSHMYLQQPRND
jgi:hypothetical protein